MYDVSLPGGDPNAADGARAWITTITDKELPALTQNAATIVCELVTNSAHHTCATDLIKVTALPINGGGLRIEVRDPGKGTGRRDWSTVSKLAHQYGVDGDSATGHLSWAEVRPAVTARMIA